MNFTTAIGISAEGSLSIKKRTFKAKIWIFWKKKRTFKAKTGHSQWKGSSLSANNSLTGCFLFYSPYTRFISSISAISAPILPTVKAE